MSFPGESPVARWKGKRRSQAPATENMPGRRKSRAIRARCALPGFLPVGQTCLSSFLRLPRISRRFFWKKHGPASSREVSSSDVLLHPLNPSLRNAAAHAFFRRSRYAGCRGVRRKGNRFCFGVRFYESSSMAVRCAEAPGQHRGLRSAFWGPVRRSETQKPRFRFSASVASSARCRQEHV